MIGKINLFHASNYNVSEKFEALPIFFLIITLYIQQHKYFFICLTVHKTAAKDKFNAYFKL